MSKHGKFSYSSSEELLADAVRLGVTLPYSADWSVLRKPLTLGKNTIPNPLAVQPMEGADGTPDGAPDTLTFRRYDRFARGGAGLLWFEAVAVMNEGRANPRQLCLTAKNKGVFAKLLADSLKAAQQEYGPNHRPYTVVQLTHSGRNSKPGSAAQPVIPVRNPYLDKNIAADYPLISDAELEALEDQYAKAALMAQEIGFSAVDIKCCHGYLLAELLACFTREGKYGGSFGNRTRFLVNTIRKIRDKAGDSLDITLRLGVYDCVPYPYGWGVAQAEHHLPDLAEPVELLRLLQGLGVKMVSITMGNPYYNPHVTRPFDVGPYIPPEHPLETVNRMLSIARTIKQALPGMLVLAPGFTWLREYAPFIAAGGIKDGWFDLAGFGRQSFAYPDFARDILEKGRMERNKCCTTCSNCTVIMRDGGATGCVVRDSAVYGPIYKAGREGKPPAVSPQEAEHL